MKTTRRDFFKVASVASAGVLSTGLSACNSKESNKVLPLSYIEESAKKTHPQIFNMSGYAAPKIETVRLGIIGLGQRGPMAVERLCYIDGVEIRGLCDKSMDRVDKAQKILSDHGLPLAKAYGGKEDSWKEMCQSPDLTMI